MTAARPAPTSPREVWDRLAMARAEALAADTDDYTRQGMSAEEAAKAAQDDAALILAAATEFADAVDRSGKRLAYEDAVVVTGGAGPVVVSEAEYRATPAFWEATAAGGVGRVDSVEVGRLLLHYLHTGDNVEDRPGAHRA